MNMGEAMGTQLRGVWSEDEPMARHTSWRAGGAARRAYAPVDVEDLAAALRSLPPDEPVCFVGLGSNLLVRDGGFAGTVIFTHGALKVVAMAPEGMVYAEAGVASPKVARFAAMHDRIGAEFLAGIPGTLGGALAMNAGCYGGETWSLVDRVHTIDRAGVVRIRTARDYEIGYRSVVRRERLAGQEWFVAAWLRLACGDGAASRAVVKDLLARRIAAQPLNQPNAGSVFRNPPGDYAARLIEASGLKGRRIGGAMISTKHANFIVNVGASSAADIEALIRLAQAEVLARFGVSLEPEVRIIGARA